MRIVVVFLTRSEIVFDQCECGVYSAHVLVFVWVWHWSGHPSSHRLPSRKTPRHLGSTPIADFVLFYLSSIRGLETARHALVIKLQQRCKTWSHRHSHVAGIVNGQRCGTWGRRLCLIRLIHFWIHVNINISSLSRSLAFCSSSSESVTEATPSLSSIPP